MLLWQGEDICDVGPLRKGPEACAYDQWHTGMFVKNAGLLGEQRFIGIIRHTLAPRSVYAPLRVAPTV